MSRAARRAPRAARPPRMVHLRKAVALAAFTILAASAYALPHGALPLSGEHLVAGHDAATPRAVQLPLDSAMDAMRNASLPRAAAAGHSPPASSARSAQPGSLAAPPVRFRLPMRLGRIPSRPPEAQTAV